MSDDPLRALLRRRDLLSAFAMSASGLALGCGFAPPAVKEDGAVCGPATERNIEGPFFRARSPERFELVRPGDAGQRLEIVGRVLDSACRPVPGAIVDIWHADAAGGYDNDTADMRFRGHVLTDADGRYRFLTLVPGRYLNGQRFRPAHVHYKVGVDGKERLTTQLYFQGDAFIEGDAFVRPSLIRPLVGDEKAAHVDFDVVLA